jgi:carboxypeptidase M
LACCDVCIPCPVNSILSHTGIFFQVGAPQFSNGTTNGAAWYPLTGGMQDYNYIWHGCMEITLELSCCKYPPASELPKFWEDNRNSLLQFIGEAHRGVKGFVKDEAVAVPIEGASMKVSKMIYIKST